MITVSIIIGITIIVTNMIAKWMQDQCVVVLKEAKEMATYKFITCDRCGKQFEYKNEKWAAILKAKKLKKFREIKLFYGNLSGYDYAEYSYELCGECTKKLDRFLRGEQE